MKIKYPHIFLIISKKDKLKNYDSGLERYNLIKLHSLSKNLGGEILNILSMPWFPSAHIILLVRKYSRNKKI